MKIFKQLVLVLLLIAGLSSCVNYEEVEIKDIKSIKLKEFSQKGLVVESEVKISNPNSFDIKIVDSEFNVFIKDKGIGKARIDSDLELSSNTSEYHTLIMRSGYDDLSKNALSTLLAVTAGGGDKIDFKVDGFIVGKAMWMKKKVEVKHEGLVPLRLF